MIGGSLTLAVLVPLIVLTALVAVVILPARTDRNDVSGQKVYAKFLLTVTFLFVFSGMFAAYGVAWSLTGLIGRSVSCSPATGWSALVPPNLRGPLSTLLPGNASGQDTPACASPTSFSVFPGISGHGTPGDRAARGTVLFGLLLLFSLVVVWMHGHAAGRLFASDEVRRGPPGRVLDAYLFSTGFVAVVVLLLATVGALYGLFAVIGPGTFGASGSGKAAQQFISGGVLAVLADAVLWWHVRMAWKLHAPAKPPVAGAEPPSPPVGDD